MILLKEAFAKKINGEIVTYSIILSIILYLFRSSIPVFKYPFFVLYISLLVYSLMAIRKRGVSKALSELGRDYFLIILLIAILISSFFLSHKLYLIIFKDCVNSVILLSILFYMSILIDTKQKVTQFYNGMILSILYSTVIIAVDSLLKVFNIFYESPIVFTDASILVFKGIDYNFAILPVIVGIMAALYLLTKTSSSLYKTIYTIFLIIYTISVILSGSRRGLFVLGVILLVLFLVQLFTFVKKESIIKRLGYVSRYFLISLAGIAFLSLVIIFKVSYENKNKMLLSLGTRNLLSTKVTIASKIYKYYSLFNEEVIFTDFFDKFWTAEMNPYDPESGWGRRMHKTIYPLQGKNVEIVPPGAKGYMLDSTCNADNWNNSAVAYTHIRTGLLIKEDEIMEASVYCYMSENFNATWARVICGGQKIGTVDGLNYDTTKKGTWQKLTCKVYNVTDTVAASFYFASEGAQDFSGLKGHIIFAYPEVKFSQAKFNELDPKSVRNYRFNDVVYPIYGKNSEIVPAGYKGYLVDSTCLSYTWGGDAYSQTLIKGSISIKKNQILEASVFCYMSDDFNGTWAKMIIGGEKIGSVDGLDYDTTRKGTWQKLNCKIYNVEDNIAAIFFFSKSNATNFNGLKGQFIFAYPQVKITDVLYNPFEPEFDESRYIHDIVFPIAGRNAEIVPAGYKGYVIDSTCQAYPRGGNAYFQTLLKGGIGLKKNEIMEASVFCYMSNDFNGSWARMICGGLKFGSVNGLNYDTTRKGTWQKLSCKIYNVEDTVAASLYFSRLESVDFNDLKGQFIFAYPQIEIVKTLLNPLDPEFDKSGKMHNVVFPLTGKNVEIAPSGAKGYLINSNFPASTWDGNAYFYKLIQNDINIKEGESVEASIFCYVSEDFNGSWARIVCRGPKIGSFSGSDYDVSRKGTWQKLTCKVSRIDNKIDVNLYFCKNGATDFSGLKGYLIFASPHVEITRNSAKVMTDLKRSTNTEKGSYSYSLNQKPYTIAGFGYLALPYFSLQFQNLEQKELIRDLAFRIISEDTTYFPYKNDLTINHLEGDFFALRFAHWSFAMKIFTKEYNWRQKLFGGGYSFINWFSYYFSGDKTKSDYPHNPFFQVLLYSGILGLLIYSLFMYRVIFYYFKYRREYPMFFIFFAVIFIFSFFSAGSPFDPPIMGFFVILPFFIHHIHKRDKSE